jgi:hypothetical protein
MRLTSVVASLAMAAMPAASLCAEQQATAQKAVCMELDQPALMGVRPLASAMFASIGVRIDWYTPEACPAGVGAIQVRLSHDSPRVHSSAALAFARPYQGTIVVFLDRVQQLKRKGVQSVMAHVLVHEITHVLEGINRHSATGIMKARWTYDDYFEMRRKPLAFAQEDINLIHDALKVPRVAVAGSLTPEVAGQ